MLNSIPGPLDEDERLRHTAPAVVAIIPVEERGRHELLRIAASLAQGLPDGYARQILRAATALAAHPAPIERRLLYAPNRGTQARVGGTTYVLGRLEYVCQLHLHPHQAEVDAADELERQGNLVYAVVAERAVHWLGLIAIKRTAVAATELRSPRAMQTTAHLG